MVEALLMMLQSKDNQIIYFEDKIRERNTVFDIYGENEKSQGRGPAASPTKICFTEAKRRLEQSYIGSKKS